jgi:type II secretion system protein G
MKSARSGFTLVELLIVVAIIGIIAAISIPNLLNAIQRGKQKRTMGDMRTCATADQAYAVDNGQLVVAPVGAFSSLRTFFETTYVNKLPTKDGWSTDFSYVAVTNEFTITSYGKDRNAGGGGAIAANGGTTNFKNDIVFSTGTFVQFPDGSQN